MAPKFMAPKFSGMLKWPNTDTICRNVAAAFS